MIPIARSLQNWPAVHGAGRDEVIFEEGSLRLVEVVICHGGEREGEALGKGPGPLLGRPIGESHADEVLLDLGSPVVEDEADYRREGHDSLYGETGRQVDGALQHAHGGSPEKGARELEPLRPG